MTALGPDVNRTVQRDAVAHRAKRRMPDFAEHAWAWTMNVGQGELIVGIDGHPMIDFDRELLRLARPIMVELARAAGHPIHLVRFDRRGNSIETVEP